MILCFLRWHQTDIPSRHVLQGRGLNGFSKKILIFILLSGTVAIIVVVVVVVVVAAAVVVQY